MDEQNDPTANGTATAPEGGLDAVLGEAGKTEALKDNEPKAKKKAKKAPEPAPATDQDGPPPGFRCSLLVYDVPADTDLKTLPGKVHPSVPMHKVGIRINLSCWVIPETLVPWDYLSKIGKLGVHWEMSKFDPADADNLLKIVTRSLRKEVRDIGESCKKSIGNYEARLDKEHPAAPDADSAEEARKKFWRAASVAWQRTMRLLKDVEQAAGGFHIGAQTGGLLDRVRAACNKAKTGARAKAEMYEAAAKGLLDPTLAQAAKDGTLPPQILADALIDQGDEAQGEALAGAFADN